MPLDLQLSSSNEALFAKLLPALAQARERAARAAGRGIARPIPVLIQAGPLGDRIQTELARRFGLNLGFEFVAPATYFSGKGLKGRRQGQSSRFQQASQFWTAEVLRWHILPRVQTLAPRLGIPAAPALSERNRFAFACLLARQLERYARLQPSWPALWRQGRSVLPGAAEALSEEESWQRELWRALAELPSAPPHPAEIPGREAIFPEEDRELPLFLVGSSLLDPLLMLVTEAALEEGRSISFHCLLPTLGYLGDKPRRPRRPEDASGNPLIRSLGQQAVGAFRLLEQLSPQFQEWEDPSGDLGEEPASPQELGDTLLQQVQNAIRRDLALDDLPAMPETAAHSEPDPSLRLHSCHSPRRELEILRDELLRAFAELPDLKPEEVLVAAPDFDTYSPFVDSLLKTGKQGLPVRLTAVPLRQANAVAVGLLSLLRLSLGRCTASELIELLNLRSVQEVLGIYEEPERARDLAELLRRSGLTHGLDGEDRGAEGIVGTWRAALDRPLAGLWVGTERELRDAQGAFVHPIASELHNDEALQRRFLAWLSEVARQLKSWKQSCPARDWSERLLSAVDKLLYAENLDEAAVAFRRHCGELAQVEADTALDAGAILDWLQPKLDNATSLGTQHNGEILVGRPEQLQGLPCRVLAILGLQDGAFPRSSREPSWDLISHSEAKHYLSLRQTDRQWFLEAILAPRERLILSASNRSTRGSHDGPLSSCAEELLRFAARLCPAPAEAGQERGAGLIVRHRIQPFARDYFTGEALPRSFDTGAAAIARDFEGPAGEEAESEAPFFSGPLDLPTRGDSAGPERVSVEDLIRFWKNPARGFIQALGLSASQSEADDSALDEPPLSLDALGDYQVRRLALELQVSDKAGQTQLEQTISRLSEDRQLPPAILGRHHWQTAAARIEELASWVKPKLSEAQRVDFEGPVGEAFLLQGEAWLRPGAGGVREMLLYQPLDYSKRPDRRLDAYLRALSASALLKEELVCVVHSLDQPEGHVCQSLSPESSEARLRLLLSGYAERRRQPLCFAPETSAALASLLCETFPQFQKPSSSSSEAGPEPEPGITPELRAAWMEKARGIWLREPSERYHTKAGEGLGLEASWAWRHRDAFAAPLDEAWLHWTRRLALPLQHWWEGEPS